MSSVFSEYGDSSTRFAEGFLSNAR
jgi:hypothetical protein